MTLSTATSARSNRLPGFTLVEMLIVIGIIVLLIGILAPALNIAYTHAIRNRMMLDIQSISAALEAYKSDMRTYPTLDYGDTTVVTGTNPYPVMKAAYPASVLLCRALIAPGVTAYDGANGPGFTTIPNGQVYGPYLEPSRFKLVIDPGLATADPHNNYIADRYNHPILYFLANRSANITNTTVDGFVNYWLPSMTTTPQPMYNLADDQGNGTNPALCLATETPSSTGTPKSNALSRMQIILGDKKSVYSPALSPPYGQATPVTTGSYLLWSAGPDEVFGIDLTLMITKGASQGNVDIEATYVPNCDDATNFLNLK